MNVASNGVQPFLFVLQQAGRYFAWMLAGFGLFVLVAIIAKPTLPPAALIPSEADGVFGELRSPADVPYSPHVPDRLVTDGLHREIPGKREEFLFNFRVNSFEELQFPTPVEAFASTINRLFHNAIADDSSRAGLVTVLIEESRQQDLHPCFVTALLLSPGRLQELFVPGPDEGAARANLVGVGNLDVTSSVEGITTLAVRYLGLLSEVYPGQGNIMALAYWTDIAAVESLQSRGRPFESNELDLLQTSVSVYQRCLAQG